MEFRCRLASPNGEIVEGVYAAESEARLRHEMEEKGLYLLSVQPRNAIAGVAIGLPQRRGVSCPYAHDMIAACAGEPGTIGCDCDTVDRTVVAHDCGSLA